MRAFVIRGFGVKAGVDFDRVHEQLIGPALETVGLEGGTTGLVLEAGNVRDDVIRELVTADLVVADVSIHNANVFYELGVRHAVRGRATVLIRARIDEVPFDLRGERYLSYDRAAPAEAVQQLVQVLRETLATERVDSPVFAFLPGLATGRRDTVLDVPRDLAEDIGRARDEKLAGDLRLIGEEVVGLRFEQAALRAVAQASTDVGDDLGARDAWERVRAAHPDDFPANRALSDTYRRLGDLVASDQAVERALGGAPLDPRNRAELFALRASNGKRRWTRQWRCSDDPAVRRRRALRSRELEGSLRSYRRGFEEDLNHWYSGINALAMGRITLELAARDRSAWDTRFDTDEDADVELRRLDAQVASLASTVRASLDSARTRAHRDGTVDPWLEVSVADLRFLTCDEPARVGAAYEAAMSPVLSRATVRSIAEQVELYRDLEILVSNAEAALAVLPDATDQATAQVHPVVFSGHMIDAPGREHPRFPPGSEAVAGAAVRDRLGELQAAAAAAGAELLGIAGASDGGDLLFHEACHDLGVTTHVLLPVPELVYRATALSRQASRWSERYHTALRRAAVVRTLGRGHTLPGWLATRPDYDTWQRSNRWVLHDAWVATTTGRVTVLALWDGQPGDGRGGVADMVATGMHRGADVVTLDTVGLFGLPDDPADHVEHRPAPAGVRAGDPPAPAAVPVPEPEGGTAIPGPPDRVGPMGGAVSTPPTAAETATVRRDAVDDGVAAPEGRRDGP